MTMTPRKGKGYTTLSPSFWKFPMPLPQFLGMFPGCAPDDDIVFLWTIVPDTYSREDVSCVPVSGLVVQRLQDASACLGRPLCASCSSWEGHKVSTPSRLFTCPSDSRSAASIWAVLCRPNDLLRGSITLHVSWLMQSSVGRSQGSRLPCPPAHRAC